MDRTDHIWQRADAAFSAADKAFAEAGKAFTEADRLYARNTQPASAQPDNVYRLGFEARSKGERWKLVKKFTKLALDVLFTGKAELRFKNR